MGSTKITATPDELNQVCDGVGPTATASNLTALTDVKDDLLAAASGGGLRLLDRHVATGAETSWAQAFPATGSHAHIRITGVFAGADAAIYVAPDRGTGGGGGITVERAGAFTFLLTADVLFFREVSGCVRWQLNADAMVPGGWDVGNALHSLGIFCLDDNDGVTPVALPAGTIIEWWVE